VTKRYDDPIDVTADPFDDGAPLRFSWRGRRYDVHQHLATWREAGEWWNGIERRDRHYHRVLARPSDARATGDLDRDGFMPATGAVFDVYLDRARAGWRLARVWD
jgi:hypothetical protein